MVYFDQQVYFLLHRRCIYDPKRTAHSHCQRNCRRFSLSSREAAEKYGISKSLAAKYATDYRRENGLPVRTSTPRTPETKAIMLKSSNDSFHLEDYQSMTKDQLIEELIKSKINEARAKKGYEVKGDGQNKEFISLSSKNSKS